MRQADAKQCFIRKLPKVPCYEKNTKPNEIKHLQRKFPILFLYSLKTIYTPPTFFTLLPFTGKTSLCVYKKFVFLALLGFGADFPKIREFCQKALAYHATTRIE
jgi:hypothetical protein